MYEVAGQRLYKAGHEAALLGCANVIDRDSHNIREIAGQRPRSEKSWPGIRNARGGAGRLKWSAESCSN